ncbi:MAG: SGNH/GDSL hydrolase family protein [Bacteroidota bacterium]|nr:SGNH/GDSL hydrolase family protein [Candidatus Kapabacteria bacterium]MDW8220700.1 SGNH/GDSL hydrolase family protein [Bacteroidota bacterium]
MTVRTVHLSWKQARASVVCCVWAILAACSPVFSPITPGTGSLGALANPDGTPIRYVALGNSLTAGFQSGAVVASETKYAYPTLMAVQMGLPFGDEPGQYQYMKFPDNGGIGTRNRITAFDANGSPQFASVSLSSAPSNAALPRPYNNLGIPGALLRDMHPAVGDPLYERRFSPPTGNPLYNPFFGAVLRNTAVLGRTCVEQAARLNPNLVTIFIGNNDVLGYASSGGANGTNFVTQAMMPNAAPAPTETPVFTAQFNALMDTCARRMPNAKFIVSNIPDVLAAPFFTTAGPQLRAGLVATLNNTAVVPAALATLIRQILPNFPNGIIVRSSAAPGGLKQLSTGDLFLLTSPAGVTAYIQTLIAAIGAVAPQVQANPAMAPTIVAGVLQQNPMPNALVLDEAEQAVVRRSTAEFNQAIAAAVARYSAGNRAILFDAHKIVNDIRINGYPFQGQTALPGTNTVVSNVLRFDFVSGGFFSLDGIHPSSRGYGAVANEMLKLINATYNANIPLIPLIDIPGLPIGQAAF